MEKPEKIVLKNRTEYRLNGELHREDGPAIIFKDGSEVWYLHGQLHREDGPTYNKYGQLHREDGPAIIWRNRDEKWLVDHKKLTEKDVKTAKQILSGKYPFKDLPLLINHPTLKYFAKHALTKEVPTP